MTPEQSIDLYMLRLAAEKHLVNKPYVDALMDIAVDRKLLQ